MSKNDLLALGLDFGTASVRALLVDLKGNERASAVVKYPRGQITQTLPGDKKPLPVDFALQHPGDWLESSAKAARRALAKSGADAQHVIGIGVDFTSCTMLPSLRDGTPLCLLPEYRSRPLAWPKLWKHHGAKSQTERINQVARRRKEPWLARYGGTIGLEWFFPKILETLEEAPDLYDAAEVWLEAGDWYVWQLVGGDATELPRSTCQAGYKAMWSGADGYPSPEFFAALHPKMARVVVDKMPGRLIPPSRCAGELNAVMAKRLGLPQGIPVSAAIIDAHAGVPGAGVAEPDTLVMVMGTSSCHMLNARKEVLAPGVAGVVQDGILPGYFGYETGQAAVGDAFEWLRVTLGQRSFREMTVQAHSLRGAFTGLALHHGFHHLYRATLEASAFGLRWIIEVLEDRGLRVKGLVATGGLPHHSPLLMQIYADVLGRPITIHPSQQGPALGAAILGALAAGKGRTGFQSAEAAIAGMAKVAAADSRQVSPERATHRQYDGPYLRYREMARLLDPVSARKSLHRTGHA